MSFWDHPVEKLEEALNLKKQIAALHKRLGDLFGGEKATQQAPTPTKSKSGRRKTSAATLAKMRASQQARWAQIKGTSGDSKGSAVAPSTSAPAKKKKKGTLTPEGRAKLSAAMKARWAARKQGDPAPNE